MAKLLQDAAAIKKRLRQSTQDGENSMISLKKTKVTKEKIVIETMPTTLTTSSSTSRSSKKSSDLISQPKPETIENVIYVGHIPNGFFERPMRMFFSQFGVVKRLRLFRSKKTNRSKGYAFVEFEDVDVARTVSESVNGYIMYDRTLVSHVVPKDKIHRNMFKQHKRLNMKDGTDGKAISNKRGKAQAESVKESVIPSDETS